jgi:membrane fusion protein, multidrug efflux system
MELNKMKRKIWIWIFPLALVLLFIFLGVLPRLANQQELQATVKREETRLALVNVVTATRSQDTTHLALPGQIQPLKETPLFARTQGYLKKRYVDIGSRVRAGQLLATIDAPELGQELRRARAEQKLAGTNLERSRSVTLPGAVAQQDLDSRAATYEMNAANVGRLEALLRLQQIRAPFSGVITARNIEIGALLQASNATPLFTLSQLDTLRVLIDVPQTYYRSIKVGQQVRVKVPELPNRAFTGQVIRTSGVLRPESRTMLTEVIIPNRQQELMSGLYGQVHFQVQPTTAPLIIPANTLIIKSGIPTVVVVGAQKTLHLQAVEIGRDFGTGVEIIQGLRGGEHLVTNPTDDMQEGQAVRVAAAAK